LRDFHAFSNVNMSANHSSGCLHNFSLTLALIFRIPSLPTLYPLSIDSIGLRLHLVILWPWRSALSCC